MNVVAAGKSYQRYDKTVATFYSDLRPDINLNIDECRVTA